MQPANSTNINNGTSWSTTKCPVCTTGASTNCRPPFHWCLHADNTTTKLFTTKSNATHARMKAAEKTYGVASNSMEIRWKKRAVLGESLQELISFHIQCFFQVYHDECSSGILVRPQCRLPDQSLKMLIHCCRWWRRWIAVLDQSKPTIFFPSLYCFVCPNPHPQYHILL